MSGFRCCVYDSFVLMECYAVYIGIYRRFGTTCWSHIQGLSLLTLEYGTDRLSRNVVKYLPIYTAQYPRRTELSADIFNVIVFLVYFFKYILYGRDSSVGIATRYGLEGPGINSQWDEIFRTYPDRSGAHPASCTMGTGSFPRENATGACC
jgi:hypothetical protein